MSGVAAIDCGTNSIRLLIAEVVHMDGDEVEVVDLDRRMQIVRLGEGVDETGEFSPQALERTFEALPVDAAAARHYGRLAAAVTAAGRSPRARVMDLLIAATAAANSARLATRNARDLAGLEHLVEIVDLA